MSNSRLLLHIKLSALKAGASAATVLLTCVAILPVRSLIDRAFDGSWGAINWKISAGIILTISGLWFVVLFSSNLLELRASDLRQQAPSPTFPARVFIRLIYSACAGLSAVLFWGLRKDHEPAWMQWLSLSFGLLAFLSWPRTITLEESGLSQRSLVGTRRTLPYSEVEYISYERYEQTTNVVGTNTTIRHTEGHSDPALFHSLLEERTGKEVQG